MFVRPHLAARAAACSNAALRYRRQSVGRNSLRRECWLGLRHNPIRQRPCPVQAWKTRAPASFAGCAHHCIRLPEFLFAVLKSVGEKFCVGKNRIVRLFRTRCIHCKSGLLSQPMKGFRISAEFDIGFDGHQARRRERRFGEFFRGEERAPQSAHIFSCVCRRMTSSDSGSRPSSRR